MPTRPVRVQPAGCGCDDTACEFSRLCDGYVIKVLTAEEYRHVSSASAEPARQPQRPTWQQLFTSPHNTNPACWPCPNQPWIVLAGVMIDAEGKVTLINNCGPRRLVGALGGFYWSCTGVVKVTSVNSHQCGQPNQTPFELVRNQTNRITVIGEGFQENLGAEGVDLGAGISKVPGTFLLTRDTTTNRINGFKVDATVDGTAEEGLRDVVVVNPDCSTAICVGALRVPPVTPRARLAPRQTVEEAPARVVTEEKPRRRRRPSA